MRSEFEQVVHPARKSLRVRHPVRSLSSDISTMKIMLELKASIATNPVLNRSTVDLHFFDTINLKRFSLLHENQA